MNIFESHTHFDNDMFNADRHQIIKKCQEAGVQKMINVGCDKQSTSASLALADKYDFIYATAGFHPHDATELDIQFLKKAAQHPKVVAIGEIGLDYFRNLSPRDVQISAFKKQIELAMQLDLPIVIHDRDAHQDIMQILLSYMPQKVVFHCFAGDIIMAQKIIECGWYISFTGNITFKKSLMDDIIYWVPDDKYLIETDSPYLSPHPHRGKRNDSSMLRYNIEYISQIKRQPPKMIATNTWKNAHNFFNLKL